MVGGGFERKWQAMNYEFDIVGLALNNNLPDDARSAFLGLADIIIDVELASESVLSSFNLVENDFNGGFVYSIAELCCIHACTTDYLIYVQGDCAVTTGDWITEGIQVLEDNPDISVISPASEVNTWHNETGLDAFFSDQCFLVRTEEFKNPLVMDGGPDIPEYPSHGKDSFEKKVAQYLRAQGKYRKILTNHWYIHG